MLETLYAKDVFAIPMGEYWNIANDRIWMLYAPKHGGMQLVSHQELLTIERELNNSKSIPNTLTKLSNSQTIPIMSLPKTPDDLLQIDLLLNYKCNFHCIYCYSAKGRSSEQGNFETYKAVIDYLFCSGRKQTSPYLITFSGGGEPLISFHLIKQIVEYTESVAKKHSEYYYSFGMVSNGSLLTPEIALFLLEHNIDLAISFEILKQFQDKERGHYDDVSANIDMLTNMNVPFGVRTTFTNETVGAMCDMIKESAYRFHGLKHIVFDVVLSPDLFPSPIDLQDYYDKFLSNFYKAKSLAANYGILLESNAVETMSLLRERTCIGKIVVTPSATISTCSRVSSPMEKLYPDYVYGHVENGKVYFDKSAFNAQMQEHNIYSTPECKHCFAKLNCGGGCRLFHQSFGEAFIPVRCEFVRKALREELFLALSECFKKDTNKNLHSFIQEQINLGKC